MQIKYKQQRFTAASREIIDMANVICAGYDISLTLRQLYYQFITRDFFPNSERSYNRLQSIIADARMAGEFDWDYIIDRTRNLVKRDTWDSPEEIIKGAAQAYHTDLWAPQKRRLEVWIEKDAAIGVIERICDLNSVPYFSCRGYTSASEMWAAGTRIGEYLRNGERTVILHIGDHDPSGLDMTRDIEDRLRTFIHQDWVNEFCQGMGSLSRGDIRRSMRDEMRSHGSEIADDELPWEMRRIALTIEQIDRYSPPPNYAKQSDSRYEQYVAETGLDESWELDALEPTVMQDLIQDHIDAFRDDEAFGKAEAKQEHERKVLLAVKDNWDTISKVHGKRVADASTQ